MHNGQDKCFEHLFFKCLICNCKNNVLRERLNGFSSSFYQTKPGKCSLKGRAAAWRMANVDDRVIYNMALSQSPAEATHSGCVIQQ